MGAEAKCTAELGGKTSTGTALLEARELIFRGEGMRMAIPLAGVTRIDASGGRLSLTYAGGTAVFTLGTKADVWANKIRNPKPVIDKLDVKPHHRVVTLRIRDAALVAQLRERAAFVSSGRLAKDADLIFLGAETLAELDRLPALVPYLKRDGAIWTITPKGKSGVKDTDIMAIARDAGLVAIKVVGFSGTHSANKFVIPRAAR